MRTKFLFLFSLTMIFSAKAQTKKEIKEIVGQYDTVKLNSFKQKLIKEASDKQQAAHEMAQKKGWPTIKKMPNGSIRKLIDISPAGNPIYEPIAAPLNTNAAIMTRTVHLNSGGSLNLNLNGENMKAYIWEPGVPRTTHQEFGGRLTSAASNPQFNYNATSGNTFDYQNHATHVCGTVIGSGMQSGTKGMAPNATAIEFNASNDIGEATDAVNDGMLLSNHSYLWLYNTPNEDGYPKTSEWAWVFGAYDDIARKWDELMYNAPYYLMVAATGNEGNGFHTLNTNPLEGNSGYDKLLNIQTAKNNLTVANSVDGKDGSQPNDPSYNFDANGNLIRLDISPGSSQGPTDDYRIKPDITGNGYLLNSAWSISDNSYKEATGTSMASPNVMGSLLLLQQHSRNTFGHFMKAATLKGLALHTASDPPNTPAGPDVIYGWGLMNAKLAAQVISSTATSSYIGELNLTNGGTNEFIVHVSAYDLLKASISWTDPAGTPNSGTLNNTTPVLVNDLDVRVTRLSDNYVFYPWKLNSVNTNTKGDNQVDPFERIDVGPRLTDEFFKITINHKGSLSSGNQNYSLIITGITTSTICVANDYTSAATKSGSSSVHVSNNIYTRDNVPSGVGLMYVAGNTIFMDPGFYAAQGSDYYGVIESCADITRTRAAESANIDYEETASQQNIVINNIPQDNAIQIYPNPTNDKITIDMPNVEDDTKITIINYLGQQVYSGSITDTKTVIDLSLYTTGVYVVKIMNNELGKVVKVVKN